MGQAVVINRSVEMGDLLIIDSDRSLTGQDGVALTPGARGEAVPGRLAERIFDLDPEIDHLFVLQNTITMRRRGGWDEATKSAVLSLVEGFLLFY